MKSVGAVILAAVLACQPPAMTPRTSQRATGKYARNVEYYALAHASRFVRPGARRIASESSDQSLPSVAFRNGDDGSRVLIVVNTGDRGSVFSVRLGDRAFRFTLPAASVVTFAWSR